MNAQFDIHSVQTQCEHSDLFVVCSVCFQEYKMCTLFFFLGGSKHANIQTLQMKE